MQNDNLFHYIDLEKRLNPKHFLGLRHFSEQKLGFPYRVGRGSNPSLPYIFLNTFIFHSFIFQISFIGSNFILDPIKNNYVKYFKRI